MLFEFLLSISFLILFYIYYGYLIVLKLIDFFYKNHSLSGVSCDGNYAPKITVLITAYNEEEKILKRVENILQCEYFDNSLEVVVASDGSTDGTDRIVNSISDNRVKLFRPETRVGKTETQNLAIQYANGEIIVFTDAESKFENNFLINLVKKFSNSKVGCVTGSLHFTTNIDSTISVGQGYYWSYELKIRKIESRLGMLAVSSGACMAVRKSLFNKMDGAYGEDCIIPLDVILNKHYVVHASNAIAYDRMECEIETELSTRSRMTLRNWQGTWSKKTLLNPFKFPSYSFSLWSHKILRWLSPIFVLILSISAFILSSESIFYWYVSLAVFSFYIAGIVGWIVGIKGLSIPLVSNIYVFILANIGFMKGLFGVIKGKHLKIYRN
jgi:cellulose synthase/poly-beta-1,6-N-acetylglucosamine synthase-like glycosyltransferase